MLLWQTYLLLWIAFKIYYLCSRKQQTRRTCVLLLGCELLSKFIIFAVGNNLILALATGVSGCELLSKFIIFAVGNNNQKFVTLICNVVNCFQNLLSLQSETTFLLKNAAKTRCELLSKFIIFAVGNNFFKRGLARSGLWIAFKIYYLCSRKQHFAITAICFVGCELLSKFIIFAVGNNLKTARIFAAAVVNCFQNLLSLQSETTDGDNFWRMCELWIAFKIYYLCSRKQHSVAKRVYHYSCELLSKFIIFAVGNNN